ncbi:hypothetical protein J1614_003317 [Plenodomus biglobosus]|nr:hypothetical protein J1614_003317 [Plenodomus biglobosus]
MHIVTILNLLLATALASPLALPQSGEDPAWEPAPGTTVTCDAKTDKYLGLYIGPQMEDVLNKACAAMMPECAFPQNNPDLFCIATVDFPLDGPKSSVQSALVQGPGGRLPGWKAKLAVYPPQEPKNEAGVFWQVKDCYGYFAHMLVNWVGKGGCHSNAGFGLGNITAGTGSSLEGTIFEITAVESP